MGHRLAPYDRIRCRGGVCDPSLISHLGCFLDTSYTRVRMKRYPYDSSFSGAFDMSDQSRRGLFFEEFTEGLAMESRSRTITEADIVNFAGISGDFNPMHTDAEYAKNTAFGAR